MLSPFVLLAAAMAVSPPSPPAPVPSMKELITTDDIKKLTAKAKSELKPGQAFVSEPVLSLLPYNLMLDYRVLPNTPAIHELDAELFYVVSGRGELTVGGVLENEKRTNDTNLEGNSISGGQEYLLSKGDFFLVPPGTAHMWAPLGGPLTEVSLHLKVRH